MLNSYVWDLYLKSGGDKAVAFFKNNLSPSLPLAYAEGIANFHKQYSVSKDIVNLTRNELLDYIAYYHESGFEEYDVINDYLDGDIEENDAREDIDTIFDEYYQDFLEDKGSDKMVFNVFTYTIASYSTGLSITYPGLFVPYYFFSTYNVLTMIADTFGIELPEIPRKSDYKARTWHYANLCKSFYCFRKENHLSYYEFCAFLYDFAPHYIGGIDSYIIKDLPDPKAAFFIGGCGDNEDAEAENNPEEITHWQCNPDTRVGDMIVMYLRTPISSISSVWRSQSVGFIDPFFYYYRCTFIHIPQSFCC